MDQPVSFQLLGSEESLLKLEGVAMELEDSLYPLLREVTGLYCRCALNYCLRRLPPLIIVQLTYGPMGR